MLSLGALTQIEYDRVYPTVRLGGAGLERARDPTKSGFSRGISDLLPTGGLLWGHKEHPAGHKGYKLSFP
mgnify:CR=1 FL=1